MLNQTSIVSRSSKEPAGVVDSPESESELMAHNYHNALGWCCAPFLHAVIWPTCTVPSQRMSGCALIDNAKHYARSALPVKGTETAIAMS